MNFVSIILYAGSVFSKLVPTSVIIAIACLIIFVVCSIAISETRGEERDGFMYWRKIVGTVGIISLLLIVFIPNQDTLYLIAASELGEEVVTNPEVVEVATELKNVILDKIKAVGE